MPESRKTMPQRRSERLTTAHLMGAFIGTPVAMRSDMGLLQSTGDLGAFFEMLFLDDPVSRDDDSGVRVVKIRGGIYRGFYYDDYRDITTQVDDAIADASVQAIVLDIDSPGGTVSGMRDCVDHLYGARGQKPIVAVANDAAASAAYAIASAADKVFAARTGQVGSVGTIATHVDRSKQKEKNGVRVTEIKSGRLKYATSGNKPLGKDGRELLERLVFESSEDFIAMVARNRGIDAEAIRDLQGALFTAADGVENGLIDGVSTLNEVIADLSPSESRSGEHRVPGPRADMEAHMSNENGNAGPGTGTEEQPTAGSEAGAEVVDINAARSEGHAAGAQEARAAERERASEINELCALAGCPEMAAELITGEQTVAQVREQLVNARADKSGPEVQGQHATDDGFEEPVINAAAIYEKRAAARR